VREEDRPHTLLASHRSSRPHLWGFLPHRSASQIPFPHPPLPSSCPCAGLGGWCLRVTCRARPRRGHYRVASSRPRRSRLPRGIPRDARPCRWPRGHRTPCRRRGRMRARSATRISSSTSPLPAPISTLQSSPTGFIAADLLVASRSSSSRVPLRRSYVRAGEPTLASASLAVGPPPDHVLTATAGAYSGGRSAPESPHVAWFRKHVDSSDAVAIAGAEGLVYKPTLDGRERGGDEDQSENVKDVWPCGEHGTSQTATRNIASITRHAMGALMGPGRLKRRG